MATPLGKHYLTDHKVLNKLYWKWRNTIRKKKKGQLLEDFWWLLYKLYPQFKGKGRTTHAFTLKRRNNSIPKLYITESIDND